jgi:hypothetical protein
MFGYGDLMGGFFNFLTTIATNGRGRPFDTFLALTSHLEGNPRRRSKSLRPAGAAGRLLIYAQLVTGQGPKRGFAVSRLKSDRSALSSVHTAQPMPPWPTFASGISQLMTVPKPIEK